MRLVRIYNPPMSIPNPLVPGRPAAPGGVVPPATAGRIAPPAQWSSAALLQGSREVVIDHQGALYRLRLTASGKLILTK